MGITALPDSGRRRFFSTDFLIGHEHMNWARKCPFQGRQGGQ
jgi:hypothetical protein